jgi:hypothetical protein
LKCDPPDLCLLSSWNYRREPPAPGYELHLFKGFFVVLIWTQDLALPGRHSTSLAHSPTYPFGIWISPGIFKMLILTT